MKKNLFFICPDGHLEHFIKEKYGDNVFFTTALGAVFNFNDVNYSKSLTDFMISECITDIFIVNDTSCRFINNTLENEKSFETFSEDILSKLLIRNHSIVTNNKSVINKRITFAELNVKRQIAEIVNDKLLLQQILRAKIVIKGIVSTKAEKKWIELNFSSQ